MHSRLAELKSDVLPPSRKRRPGNCGFDCEHVFDGKGKDGKDLGLRPVERRLLEAAVMDWLAEAGLDDEDVDEFRVKPPRSVRTMFKGAEA